METKNNNFFKVEADRQLGSQIEVLEKNTKRAETLAGQLGEVFHLDLKTSRYSNESVTTAIFYDCTLEANLSGVFCKISIGTDYLSKMECLSGVKSIDWSMWDKVTSDNTRQMVLQTALRKQIADLKFTVKIRQNGSSAIVELVSENLTDRYLKKAAALIVSYLKSRNAKMKFTEENNVATYAKIA